MPRKDDGSSYKKSSNPRANIDTNGQSSDLGQLLADSKVGQWVDNGVDLWTGQQSYSDFTKRYNQLTDGWYSTIAGGIPLLSNLHNALLGRDSAKDYLDNNGMSWEDMQGYNDIKLLGRTSSAISGLANHSTSYLSNIGNDLGKLYSGQPSKGITPFGKQVYSSNYLDAW